MDSALPDTPTFAVILARGVERDPMILAKALAELRGTPVQDQVIEARSAWGILEEGLPEAEATALAGALRSRDIACAVGPDSALARLPEPEPATTRGALPDAVPILFAVAGVTLTETTTTKVKEAPGGTQTIARAAIMAGTGIPLKLGGGRKKVEKTQRTEKLLFFADLIYDDPRRRHRIDASRFDFSCLGEKMLYHPQGNLKLLLTDLVEQAPDAWQNRGARILLEGLPIRTMGYRSLEDLEREERWLLTLRAMKA
jgi:hypothetical protein